MLIKSTGCNINNIGVCEGEFSREKWYSRGLFSITMSFNFQSTQCILFIESLSYEVPQYIKPVTKHNYDLC